jgi:hypothetical protein
LRFIPFLYGNYFKVWCTCEAPTPISGFTSITGGVVFAYDHTEFIQKVYAMFWKLSLAVTALAWTMLFLSGSGLLIGSERSRLPGDGQDSLVCRYFVATSILEQAYWYAPNGFMGKAFCPRLIRI